jgi:hypothetical protein
MESESLSEIFGANQRPDEINQQQAGDGRAGDEVDHSDALTQRGVGRHDQDQAEAETGRDDVTHVHGASCAPLAG